MMDKAQIQLIRVLPSIFDFFLNESMQFDCRVGLLGDEPCHGVQGGLGKTMHRQFMQFVE